MIDLAEAPVLYIHREASGAYDATLRDGTRIKYEPPYTLRVIVPDPETAARFERWAREDAERKAKAERPARAVAMHRENPGLTFKAIAAAVGASPGSVSNWIANAAGKPKARTKRTLAALTEAEVALAQAQALEEFMRRGGACTRKEIDARAAAIGRDILAVKRKNP